jgi:uncharacterized protein with HEPN domain
MRHILVHHYFGIDEDASWVAVEKHLPELKEQDRNNSFKMK